MDLFSFVYDKMTKDLVLSVAIPLALILALLFRWDMALRQTTLMAGRKIGKEYGATGLQDAITPPWQTKFSLFTWAVILVFLVSCLFRFGWGIALALFALFILATIVAGAALLPKAGSPHYLWMIFHSLSNRLADFRRDGDIDRAAAAEDTLNLLRAEYGDRLLKKK